MTEDTQRTTVERAPKLDIDWTRTIASALAAVSSAVLLSTLGAAGTLIGAALGSIVVTVGGAIYAQTLATSRAQLARAQETARLKVGLAQAEVRRAGRRQGDDTAVEAHLAHADEQLGEAKDDLDVAGAEPSTPGWRERLVVLPWRRVALLAAGVFVVALGAITAFELVAGESVSTITGGTDGTDGDGGTTISRIGGGSGADEQQRPEDEQQPAPGDAPEQVPGEEPTAEPSEEPSQEPSSEPTPSPSLPAPTGEPSESPAPE